MCMCGMSCGCVEQSVGVESEPNPLCKVVKNPSCCPSRRVKAEHVCLPRVGASLSRFRAPACRGLVRRNSYRLSHTSSHTTGVEPVSSFTNILCCLSLSSLSLSLRTRDAAHVSSKPTSSLPSLQNLSAVNHNSSNSQHLSTHYTHPHNASPPRCRASAPNSDHLQIKKTAICGFATAWAAVQTHDSGDHVSCGGSALAESGCHPRCCVSRRNRCFVTHSAPNQLLLPHPHQQASQGTPCTT